MSSKAKGRIYLDLNPPSPYLRVEEPDMPSVRYILVPGVQNPAEIPFPLSAEGRHIVRDILQDWGLCIKEALVEFQ